MKLLNQLRWLFFTKHPHVILRTYQERWSPNTQQLTPFVDVCIYSADTELVGRLTYLLSPLNDRLYLYEILIFESFRKNGFGMAALAALSLTNNRTPIVPVKILNTQTARGFWNSVYRRSNHLFPIKEEIGLGDWIIEADRWRHLHFAADCLTNYRQRHYDEFEQLLGNLSNGASCVAVTDSPTLLNATHLALSGCLNTYQEAKSISPD